MNPNPLPAGSGVHPLAPHDAAALQADAERAGHLFATAQLARAKTRRDALRAIGRALRFADWYGANLDALYDSLCDLPDRDGLRGCVLVVHGLEGAPYAAPILDVFRDAAEALAPEGFELRVFYD